LSIFSNIFLATTSYELAEFLPEKLAYMACHFSPYGVGISNMPRYLPAGSILLLDDSMQVTNHDTEVVTLQLSELVQQFSVEAVVLDFQVPWNAESEQMASAILQAIPCPVAITEKYAKHLQCPVFLSPPPINMPLEKHLAPWKNQGVYLEIAAQATEFTVTEHGSFPTAIPYAQNLPLEDSKLHCHYNVEVFPDRAIFTLSRTLEDLAKLAEEAYALGVSGVVGLYQELCK